MARIVGVDIPKNKRIEIALTYIYGIGRSLSKKILEETGFEPGLKVLDLTDEQLKTLRDHIQTNYKVEGSLRTETSLNIKRLIEIGCYRGIRHRRGMTVRGQNTKNNNAGGRRKKMLQGILGKAR